MNGMHNLLILLVFDFALIVTNMIVFRKEKPGKIMCNIAYILPYVAYSVAYIFVLMCAKNH